MLPKIFPPPPEILTWIAVKTRVRLKLEFTLKKLALLAAEISYLLSHTFCVSFLSSLIYTGSNAIVFEFKTINTFQYRNVLSIIFDFKRNIV